MLTPQSFNLILLLNFQNFFFIHSFLSYPSQSYPPHQPLYFQVLLFIVKVNLFGCLICLLIIMLR